MDYAQLLGMTGGNQQGAGIMQNALGGGNVGAQLLGTTPAQLPGAGFQGFAPTSPVPDLLAKYRAQAAAAPPIQQYQPPPMPAPPPVQAPVQSAAPAPNLNYNPINPTTPVARLPDGRLDIPQSQWSSAYMFDPTGSMWKTNDLGQIIFPGGGGWGANDG